MMSGVGQGSRGTIEKAVGKREDERNREVGKEKRPHRDVNFLPYKG